nr:hypothetical protein [Tanacetum cinerariifolium]
MVLDLEEAKTAQAKEIASLKKRVKKLEQKRKSRTSGLKRLRKVGSTRRVESSTKASLGDQEDASKQGKMIDNIDQDVKIALVDDTHGRMNEEDMSGVNDLDGDELDVSASERVEHSVKVVEKEVSTADPVTTAGDVVNTAGIEVTTAATTLQIYKDELTLAQTLIEIKAAKPKAITTAATTVTAVGTRPKEKGIVMKDPSETPLPKPIISFQKPSQAKDKGKGKMVEPERSLKRKDQIMMDAKVVKNLEAQMQAELEEEERLARLKEEENNIDLMLFNNTIKWIEAFVLMDTELVKGSDKAVEGSEKAEEGSSKRVADKLKQEDAKRQRIEEENETAELKRCLEIIPEDDDDVTIEATRLSSKSPTIVDYKIYKEGRKSFFKIIRAY